MSKNRKFRAWPNCWLINETHIQQLMQTADAGLLSRIEELLQSCGSGLLPEDARKRREITCYKALWAIASIQTPSSTLLPLDFSQFTDYFGWQASDRGIDHYRHSVILLMKWSTFCHTKTLLAAVVNKLSADVSLGRAPNLESFKPFLERHHWQDICFPPFISQRLLQYYNGDTATFGTLDLVADVVQAFKTFSKQTPYNLFFIYCVWAVTQETLPYRFSETEEIIFPGNNCPAAFATYAVGLEYALAAITLPPLDSPKWNEPATQCFNIVMCRLCAFWCPEDSDPRPIPRSLTRYCAARKIHFVVHDCLRSSGIIPRLLRAIPVTLSSASGSPSWGPEDALDDVLVTLWHVTCSGYGYRLFYTAERCQPILDAISTAPVTPMIFSTITMLEMALLTRANELASPRNSMLSPEAELPPSTGDGPTELKDHSNINPGITLLTEFLEGWTSNFTPYEPAVTMRYIALSISIPYSKVDGAQQLRFATSIHRVLTAHTDDPQSLEVLNALMISPIFTTYEGAYGFHPWLDNPTACSQIKGILSDRLRRPRSTLAPELSAYFARLIRGLESRHPTED
ncbi:hypothetical protein B0H16DRAFT_1723479 [Mycena metata]|uniref:Uncharacterized protein n=1 Tax=Mycena metata TaxID=1033252 RepID=A0AAD7NBA6_9AGAR|nr:hypothetical protein B0H16DRAFT_1723479 [Mycena metata]